MVTINDLQEWAPLLAQGAVVSVELAAASLLVGIAIGLAGALLLRSAFRPARPLTRVYVDVFRGTPALVQLFIIYFGLPSFGLLISPFWAGVLGLGLNAGAYLTEIFRAGITSVHRGQREAALAIGLKPTQAMRYVVLPQALRVALPPTMSFAIAVFQATALTLTIAVPEIMNRAYEIGNDTFEYMPVFILAAIFYAIVSIPVSRVVQHLEGR